MKRKFSMGKYIVYVRYMSSALLSRGNRDEVNKLRMLKWKIGTLGIWKQRVKTPNARIAICSRPHLTRTKDME